MIAFLTGKGADVVQKKHRYLNEKFSQKKLSESQTKAGNQEHQLTVTNVN